MSHSVPCNYDVPNENTAAIREVDIYFVGLKDTRFVDYSEEIARIWDA